MDNKALIKQYVDTGLSIPEYQFFKLNKNLRQTYIRKRNIAISQGDDNAEYEVQFLSDDAIIKVINTSDNLEYFQSHGKLSDYVKIGVTKRKPDLFEYMIKPPEEACIEAVKYNGKFIEFIPNPSDTVVMFAVKESAEALIFIGRKQLTDELLMFAAKNHGDAVYWILACLSVTGDVPSERVQLEAVKKNPVNACYYAKEYDFELTERVKLAAVNRDGFAIKYIRYPSEKIQIAAVKNKILSYRVIKNPTEKVTELFNKLYDDDNSWVIK
mgnify:CR=1 FL=1